MHSEPIHAGVHHVAVVVQYLELDKPEGGFTYDVHKMLETRDLFVPCLYLVLKMINSVEFTQPLLLHLSVG